MDLDAARRDGGRHSRGYFSSIRIRSRRNYEIGDRISWDGRELTVMGKELLLERGQVMASYVLGHEAGFCLREGENEKLRGISLPGNVIGVKEGMVKVHLDSEESQSIGPFEDYGLTKSYGVVGRDGKALGYAEYSFRSEEDLRLGSCVRHMQEPWYVMQRSIRLHGGRVERRYWIGKKEGRARQTENLALSGASLVCLFLLRGAGHRVVRVPGRWLR